MLTIDTTLPYYAPKCTWPTSPNLAPGVPAYCPTGSEPTSPMSVPIEPKRVMKLRSGKEVVK